jgi:hypothetical protein
MGADIAGACGQLVVEQEKHMNEIGDIEDSPLCSKSSVVTDRQKRSNGRNSRKNSNTDEKLIRHLIVATGIATSCFVLSAALFVMQRRKR